MISSKTNCNCNYNYIEFNNEKALRGDANTARWL